MNTPAEYTAVIAGAIALYGAASVVLVYILRRIFPIEGNAAHVVVGIVSVVFAAIAAAQIGVASLPGIPPEQRYLAFLGLVGGVWWASQEVYRRLRGELWPTKGDTSPPRSPAG